MNLIIAILLNPILKVNYPVIELKNLQFKLGLLINLLFHILVHNCCHLGRLFLLDTVTRIIV
jgi:hypothetical protein